MMKLTTGNRKQERQKKSKQEKCRRKQDENYGKANENRGKLDVKKFRLLLNAVSFVTSKHQEFLLLMVHEIFPNPNWAIVQVRIQCRINEQ